MKLILTLLLCCWSVIQIIHSRLHRAVVDDQIYPYASDKSVPSHLVYFSEEYLEFEQIDDDTVKVGGYGLCIKSLDPMLPLQLDVRTQYLENSIWREGPIRLFVPNMCAEFSSPSRFWYNVSKLWTNNCPPKKGDKWLIETQIINVLMEFPPSFSKGPWKGYMMFSQGLLGATHKFGAILQVEFVEV